jgi:hypothetical protein
VKLTLYAVALAAGLPAWATEVEFGVQWPPDAPGKSLLRGMVTAVTTNLATGACLAKITVTLTRPQDDASREFWNKRLAFPQYAWMKEVRVWDAQRRWLWPNLSCLLRLHGIERIERYGGVDPGKGVDNDFAAVLLRKCGAGGEAESVETKQRPLVSAEWHPVGGRGETSLETIVHSARSDECKLHLLLDHDAVCPEEDRNPQQVRMTRI